MPEYLLYLLLLLAGMFLILFVKEKQQRAFENKSHQKELDRFLLLLEETKREKEAFLDENIVLGKQLAGQKAINSNLSEKLEKQLAEQSKWQEESRLRFENLSNKLLDEKAVKFARQNQENLTQLLKPFQDRIKEFEKKVEETYNRESRERFSLKEEFKRTLELNQTLSQQAENLTRALKSESKSQGDWGEYLLASVLEAAGLQEGVHYKTQVTISGEDGSRLRPDVVLFLPEGRRIVIDAKVSLTAYERYSSATEGAERDRAMKAHILSIKNHIEELWRKKYERFIERTPDFVLMFVPVEPAYNLALMNNPALYEEAFRKKVILVSVSSLMATLRIIESIWRLEKQNKNAWQIVEEGNKLYDKLVGFVTDMKDIGSRLKGAQTAYEAAMNKLSEGKGNLIGKAEKMRNLGLNPSKQLPES